MVVEKYEMEEKNHISKNWEMLCSITKALKDIFPQTLSYELQNISMILEMIFCDFFLPQKVCTICKCHALIKKNQFIRVICWWTRHHGSHCSWTLARNIMNTLKTFNISQNETALKHYFKLCCICVQFSCILLKLQLLKPWFYVTVNKAYDLTNHGAATSLLCLEATIDL